MRNALGYLILWFLYGAGWTIIKFLLDRALSDSPSWRKSAKVGFGMSTAVALFILVFVLGISLITIPEPAHVERTHSSEAATPPEAKP